MDQLGRSGDVRCWGQSGKHLLAASISLFDPKQTSGLTRHGSEMMHVRGSPMNCWGTGLFDLPVA
jgi:hypothetical protein